MSLPFNLCSWCLCAPSFIKTCLVSFHGLPLILALGPHGLLLSLNPPRRCRSRNVYDVFRILKFSFHGLAGVVGSFHSQIISLRSDLT